MSVLKTSDFSKITESIALRAEENVRSQTREDDYTDPEDGLIHCGKCGQPRQYVVPLWNKTVWVICGCRKQEIEEAEAEHRKQKIEFLRKDGFDDPTMGTSLFENDEFPDSEMSVICRNYALKFDEFYERGKGLLMSGGVGTGKTFYASCIANELIGRLHPCLVTSVGRYIRGMESSEYGGMNEKIEYLNRFDLVVFDDLGVERNTPYMNELVYAIIDSRVRSGKPMIVTTNLEVRRMSAAESIEQQRIFDRILSVCIPLSFKGESLRKSRAREEYRKDLNELKGGG